MSNETPDYKELMLAFEASRGRLSAPTVAELNQLQQFLDATPEEDVVDRSSFISRMWAVMESDLNDSKSVGFFPPAKAIELADSWSATSLYRSVNSNIAVLKLYNATTGQIIEHTRFDTGKVTFLDRPAGFPEFTQQTLLRLAGELSGDEQEVDFDENTEIGKGSTTLDMWKFRALKAEAEVEKLKFPDVTKRPILTYDLDESLKMQGWTVERIFAWHETFNVSLNGALGSTTPAIAWTMAFELANRTHGPIPMK